MATQTIEKKTSKPVEVVRTARRAYLGLFGMAYDRANMRLNQVRKLSEVTIEDCIERGDKIQTKVMGSTQALKTDAQAKVETTLGEVRETLTKSGNTVMSAMPKTIRFKGAKITELEAELASLTAKLERVSKAQMQDVENSAKIAKSAKKSVKTESAKVSTPVADAPKADLQADTQKFDATAPIAVTAKLPTEDMAVSPKAVIAATTTEIPESYMTYINDVQGYDADADVTIIRKIVNHCGIALRSRDGKFVACSDEAERQTVRDNWLIKKLGVSGETAELDAKVMAVCETMQKDRMKNRVTFYYLMAKNEGLLASI